MSRKASGAILNRRVRFDYVLGEELVCGMSLNGRQVRAARDGHVQLLGAFVTIKGAELWLNNASFTLKLNTKGGAERTVDTEAIRLLATKRQIVALAAEKRAGMSIVPTKLITNGRHIKLVIALGKGKKLYDKRETIKRRDVEREHQRMMKNG